MKYIYIYAFILQFAWGRSQNLVPNPSFETYTLCPNMGAQIESAVPWTCAASDATSSTDYYNACASGSSRGVPYCNGGFQNARSGNAFAGLYFLYPPSTREYLQMQLSSPMISNITYYVEFFVNLHNSIWNYPCNNIAANLSVSRPSGICGALLQLTPHIVNSGNPIINDTLNWIQVSGCYTAQGGEEYITIGNFFDNANTQTTGTNSASYYFVDDVSVVAITGTCVTGVKELNSNNQIQVYPNPTASNLKIAITNLSDKEKLVIKVIDVVGKEVLNESYQEELDISDLEKGIYFVSVYNDRQLLGTRKVVKE